MAAHAQSHSHRGRWISFGLALAVVAALATAGVLAARSHGSPSALASVKPKVVPLEVIGTNPVANATDVPSSAALTVDLSAPLASGSALPVLTPPVPGTWSAVSTTELQFQSASPLVPGQHETLTMPGGPNGMLSDQGQRLAATDTVSFTVAPGSTLRLQQLLAQLGYLPVDFTPATQPTSPQQEADPQQGTFAWRWPNLPASLTSLWSAGTANVITQGAVMQFEAQNGLATDGVAGPEVWTALLKAASTGTADPQPYDYVLVSKTLPENVTVYKDGAPVYNTPASRGSATSTGVTPSTGSSGPATATPRATAASRCRRPTPPSSGRSPRSGRSSPSSSHLAAEASRASTVLGGRRLGQGVLDQRMVQAELAQRAAGEAGRRQRLGGLGDGEDVEVPELPEPRRGDVGVES
jgi:peptidoglycan hydrolase-like protein with peptidoglycan-binding domain